MFSHEKLDAYRLAIEYIRWAFLVAGRLKPILRFAKDQWLRAAQSIPLNIAEGNGKPAGPDRRRYLEIARGSALECAATQDVIEAAGGLTDEENKSGKVLLDRIVAMLTRLGGRGYIARERPPTNETGQFFECDSDSEAEAEMKL